MPHLGHALVGAGLGAASAAEPRSRRLRQTWIGVLVLLACLPDVLEWLGRWAGLAAPHNALASPAALLVVGAVVVVILRFGFGERRALVPAAALAALASHALLDAIDGGVPLLWPWRADDVGVDWLHLEREQGPRRLVRELGYFAPVAAIGLLVLALRSGGRARRPQPTPDASRPSSGADWRHPAQILPLLPLLAFVAAHAYSHDQLRRGHAALERKDDAAALAHFREARRLRPIDVDADALYWVAMSHQRLGQEDLALAIYQEFLRRFPRDLPMRYGLAHLRLYARDERHRRPQEGLRLLEEVYADAPPGWYRDGIVAPALRAARQAAAR